MTESGFMAVPGSERTPDFGARAMRAPDAEAWLEVTLKLAHMAPLPGVDTRSRPTSSAPSTARPTPPSSTCPIPSPVSA